MIKQKLKHDVAQAAVMLWKKGLSIGRDAGDTSFRDPKDQLIYICPRPTDTMIIKNWGAIKGEHMVVITLKGEIVDGGDILPTLEAPMHLSIYRARPEINAIVHTHAVWSTIFAITGKNIPLIDAEMDAFLGGEVICAEYAEVGTEELGQNVVAALGKNKFAAIIQNHGAVCVGTDFDNAFNASDFLEKSAQTVVFGNLMGGVIARDKIEYTPKR
jgi:L-ribulose-5-phosphate 4-epimerase